MALRRCPAGIHVYRMRRLVRTALIFSTLLGIARGETEGFTQSIPPADLAATGLSALTPEQLARLNVLVEEYKSGALAAARRAADAASAAQRAAEAHAAQAEAQAVQSEAQAAAAKAEADRSKKDAQSYLAKAKAALAPAKAVPVPLVESTIPGKFRGWSPPPGFRPGQRPELSGGQQ